jgi:hypothetical protein
MSDEDFYEFRPTCFLSFVAMPIALHGSVDISQWNAYSIESDCELREWQDRANKEDCWRDWWDADWIEPEEEE